MVVGELAHEKDLIIIGGGPGGYHAAIRAAQLGKSVTLIEREKLGGVCLNKGCVPSKVLTHAAGRLASVKQDELFGIRSKGIDFDIEILVNHKNQVVRQLNKGIEALCQANKIEVISGNAMFLSVEKVGVENNDSYEVYHFNEAIIATGGSPRAMPGAENHPRIINGWSVGDISEIPNELLVYGDDYIALEMAMAFVEFGSKVTIILLEEESEYSLDTSINRELQRLLKKAGIKLIKGYSVAEVIGTDHQVSLVLKNEQSTKVVEGSHLFYSMSIKPNIENLGIERLGIELTSKGLIRTDATGKTSVDNIFAIGDVTEGPPLAVKAIKQGKTAAECICKEHSENDLTFTPHVIHTRPPIAWAGLTEQEAIKQGFEVKTGEFPLTGNGFAAITGNKSGLVKVIFDQDSDLLLGIHMIGEGAIELVSGGIQALEMAARDEDLLFPMIPHPSFNEALLEAVEASKGIAIHTSPKKQKVKI